MKSLSDDLDTFAAAIIHGDKPLPVAEARYPHYDLATALDIYRNNYRGNLHDALAGAYPVTQQLVGEEFFRMMAYQFIAHHPSRSGNLHHYGAAMAAFIAEFEPARGLPYLSGVATLEWDCHCAYFADDAPAFDLGKLSQLPAEQHADLHILVNPAAHLLHSKYPVAAIWRAHQPGRSNDFQIDLNSGGCIAVVTRVEGVVDLYELSAAESDWLQRLRDGATLGTATEATLERYPQFDLATALLQLVAKNVLTRFTTGE